MIIVGQRELIDIYIQLGKNLQSAGETVD